MPASERSLRVTDRYRARLSRLRQVALAQVAAGWGDVSINLLDPSLDRWVEAAVATTGQVQRRAVTLTDGYLAAYLAAETGRRVQPIGVDDVHVGVSRDGRQLADVLVIAGIAVKAKLAEGAVPADALGSGLARALRSVALDVSWSSRAALGDLVATNDQVVGWRRVASGHACGACLGAATGQVRPTDDVPEAHAYCQCTAEPVVANVDERHMRPTGPQIFSAQTVEQQNRLLGPDKAELVRTGQVPLTDLVSVSPMATELDHITETPLSALG